MRSVAAAAAAPWLLLPPQLPGGGGGGGCSALRRCHFSSTSAIQVRVTASPPLARSSRPLSLPGSGSRLEGAGEVLSRVRAAARRVPRAAAAARRAPRALGRLAARAAGRVSCTPLSAPRSPPLWKQELEGQHLASL